MAFVQALYQGLVENQRNLWIDWGEDSNPNDQWLTEIQNAIDCTDVILFIVSPESFRSQVRFVRLNEIFLDEANANCANFSSSDRCVGGCWIMRCLMKNVSSLW
jgi:hypothetical protein